MLLLCCHSSALHSATQNDGASVGVTIQAARAEGKENSRPSDMDSYMPGSKMIPVLSNNISLGVTGYMVPPTRGSRYPVC